MLTCVVLEDQLDRVYPLHNYIARIPRLHYLKSFFDSTSALQEIDLMEEVDIFFTTLPPAKLDVEFYNLIQGKCRRLIVCSSEPSNRWLFQGVFADAFLLTGFSFSEFSTSLGRFFPELGESVAMVNAPNYFFVKNKDNRNKTTKIRFFDIIAVESLHNYVRFYTLKGNVTSYLRLSDVLALLGNEPNFMQVHRCFIISTLYIDYLDGKNLKMEGELFIRIGSSFSQPFFSYIKTNTIGLGYKEFAKSGGVRN